MNAFRMYGWQCMLDVVHCSLPLFRLQESLLIHSAVPAQAFKLSLSSPTYHSLSSPIVTTFFISLLSVSNPPLASEHISCCSGNFGYVETSYTHGASPSLTLPSLYSLA